MSKLRTKEQNKRLHSLLGELGWQGWKGNLAYGFSGERTEKTSELTENECAALLEHLQEQVNLKQGEKQQGNNKMRRKILAMAHEMGWQQPDSSRADLERINHWCSTKGKFKKPLNAHNYDELVVLVSQFERVKLDFLSRLNSLNQ